MDRILLNKYFGELSKELENKFYGIVLSQSQKKVEYKKKGNYIYTPNDDIELIMNTDKDEKKITLTNVDVHVKTDTTWKFKIVKELKVIEDSYIVELASKKASFVLRLVNSICLGKDVKEGDILEGNVVGFVINSNLYPTEDDFIKNLPELEEDEASMTADGSILPIHLINNHNGKVKGEKFSADDLLMTVKGPIRDIEQFKINMNGNEFMPYFKAYIDTALGELPIVFNARSLPAGTKGFNPGYIMVAEVLISADVCINKYNQYRRESDYIDVIKKFQEQDSKK